MNGELHRLRQQYELNTTHACLLLGVSYTTLRRLERGQSYPTIYLQEIIDRLKSPTAKKYRVNVRNALIYGGRLAALAFLSGLTGGPPPGGPTGRLKKKAPR